MFPLPNLARKELTHFVSERVVGVTWFFVFKYSALSISHCVFSAKISDGTPHGSISYASLSALPPKTNYIQIVYYIMYFCLENKKLELELASGPMYSPRQLPPHGRGWINLWLSILARTGGVVGLMLGSVVITELDAGLVGIYFHRYCTVYDVCHKQNT